MTRFNLVLTLSAFLGSVISATQAQYNMQNHWVGQDFLNGDWTFDTGADPTHGTVTYVSQSTAQSEGLAYVDGNGWFVMRADNTTYGQPRQSIRINTNAYFGDGVFILDVAHAPTGCGTWPAWWTVGSNWPNNGEIDIYEGVNDNQYNQVTLHTSAGCTMPASRSETGTPGNNDCQGNQGCGVTEYDKPQSYGAALNNAGGGWFAMQRDSSGGIYVWFWPHNDASAPADVVYAQGSVTVSNWGTPGAAFPPNSCPTGTYFGQHQIVFDLDFCGDWAGAVFASSACAQAAGTTDCTSYVENNPSAFSDAYWTVRSVSYYKPNWE